MASTVASMDLWIIRSNASGLQMDRGRDKTRLVRHNTKIRHSNPKLEICDMAFKKIGRFALRRTRWAFLAATFLCVAAPLKAQENEKTIRIDLLNGPLEITARNQNENIRLISVRFNQKVLMEIKTGFGDWLDFLATYS